MTYDELVNLTFGLALPAQKKFYQDCVACKVKVNVIRDALAEAMRLHAEDEIHFRLAEETRAGLYDERIKEILECLSSQPTERS